MHYANPTLIPDKITRLMSPEDRSLLGVKTPEERAVTSQVKLEKDLQRLCEQELNRRNIVYLHLSPRAREKIGWPDLVFVINRHPVAVELKTATGIVSTDQMRILARMAENGWQTYVVRDYESFRKILEDWNA